MHSNNPEVIHFLEDKNIEFDDKTFSKAIKCHHNEIAHYIFNNYFDSSTKISDLDEDVILTIFSSANYDFFHQKLMEITFFSVYAKMNTMNLLIFI